MQKMADDAGVGIDYSDDPRPEYKDLVPGNCPKPGRFPQRVKDFDFKKLNGIWIRVIDERDFATNYTCLSAVFQVENDTHVFFPQAEQFTESHKEYRLSKEPDFDAE